jgi:hypothetical protein
MIYLFISFFLFLFISSFCVRKKKDVSSQIEALQILFENFMLKKPKLDAIDGLTSSFKFFCWGPSFMLLTLSS